MIPNKDYIGSLPGAIHDKDGTLTDIMTALGVKVDPISSSIKNDGRLQPPVATFRVGDKEYSVVDVLDAVTTKLETKVISCLISVLGQRPYLTNAAQLVAALDDIEVNPVRCSRHALYITVAHETSDFALAGVSSYTGTSPNWGFLGRGGKIWVEKKGTTYYVNGGAMSFTTGSVDSYGGAYLTEVPGGGDSGGGGGSSGSGITVIECEIVENDGTYTLTNASALVNALDEMHEDVKKCFDYALMLTDYSNTVNIAGGRIISHTAYYESQDDPGQPVALVGFYDSPEAQLLVGEDTISEEAPITVVLYRVYGGYTFSRTDIDPVTGMATLTLAD